MMPGQPGIPQIGGSYGALDPLQQFIALLSGLSFSSGLGNPNAAISNPFGAGGTSSQLGGFGPGGGGTNGVGTGAPTGTPPGGIF